MPRSTPAGKPRRPGLNRVGDLKARIDELRSAAEKFQREGDLEAASRILYGELPALERELNEAAEAESARVAGGGAKQDLWWPRRSPPTTLPR